MAGGAESWKKKVLTTFAGAAVAGAGSVVGYRTANAAIDFGGAAATTIWDCCCPRRRARQVKTDDITSEQAKTS